jgi:hypothetical protein
MRVHFYIEANPIRAGMVKPEKLRNYFWNSYRFYAHGEVDEWTKHITPPQWYIDLDQTPEGRQRAYRVLFRKYLEQTTVSWTQFLSHFIGDALWVRKMETALKEQSCVRALTIERLLAPNSENTAGISPYYASIKSEGFKFTTRNWPN